MPIVYPQILELKNEDVPYAWTERETLLYALGIGLGGDPMNAQELPFVFEQAQGQGLKATPTLASVIAWGISPGPTGLNPLYLVDGERDITFHKPVPAAGRITASVRVLGAYDKGAEKGAVVVQETVLRDAASGEPIATLVASAFARGDGGFGGPSEGQPVPHPTPSRAPDRSVDIETRPDQALLYRLMGDRNPLHADPEFARRAGFPRPILHGMCTYGITCRAVLQTYADYDPTRLRQHAARFSAPVFPGETITVDLWRDGEVISFEAHVKSRGVTVIKNGCSVLGDGA